MRKTFTKRFFQASPIDRRLIVDSVLRDLAQAEPFNDAGRVKTMIRRIRTKPVEYGIYQDKGALSD